MVGEEPPFGYPVFVLTGNAPRPPIPMRGGTTFHFRNAAIEEVLAEAKEAAGGLDVRIGGGVSTARAFLCAGLVDDLHVMIFPILLDQGSRLWDDLRRTRGHPPRQVRGRRERHDSRHLHPQGRLMKIERRLAGSGFTLTRDYPVPIERAWAAFAEEDRRLDWFGLRRGLRVRRVAVRLPRRRSRRRRGDISRRAGLAVRGDVHRHRRSTFASSRRTTCGSTGSTCRRRWRPSSSSRSTAAPGSLTPNTASSLTGSTPTALAARKGAEACWRRWRLISHEPTSPRQRVRVVTRPCRLPWLRALKVQSECPPVPGSQRRASGERPWGARLDAADGGHQTWPLSRRS